MAFTSTATESRNLTQQPDAPSWVLGPERSNAPTPSGRFGKLIFGALEKLKEQIRDRNSPLGNTNRELVNPLTEETFNAPANYVIDPKVLARADFAKTQTAAGVPMPQFNPNSAGMMPLPSPGVPGPAMAAQRPALPPINVGAPSPLAAIGAMQAPAVNYNLPIGAPPSTNMQPLIMNAQPFQVQYDPQAGMAMLQQLAALYNNPQGIR